MAHKIVPIRIELAGGIITKFTPSATIGNALLTSENADGFDVFRAYGKVPGSERQLLQAISGTTWEHLADYVYVDLLGTAQRQVVGLNGTTLYDIKSDKTVESLTTGLISEPMFDITASDRLHMVSPHNTPLKYDGNEKTQWGLTAPGNQETIVKAIDTDTGWEVEVAGDTVATSTASKYSTGSLEFNKENSSQNYVGVQTFSGSYNMESAGGENGYLWFFLPAGGLTIARTTANAVELTVGSGGTGDPLAAYNRYDFNSGDLSEGWNLLSFPLLEPDATSGTVNLDEIEDIRFRYYTTVAGNVLDDFLINKLYVTDSGTATAVSGGYAEGTTTSTYRYKTTFVSKYGADSNAGPASLPITTSGTIRYLTNIPTSNDSQVIARELWRDLDGDALFLYMVRIPDNSTTTYDDALLGADLTATTPPLAGDTSNDNTPPPKMSSVVVWKGHIFGINAEQGNQLEIGVVSEPESFPFVNALLFDRALTALAPHVSGVIVFSNTKTWVLTGTSTSDFVVTEYNSELGCVGPRAVSPIRGEVVSWANDGPYLLENVGISSTGEIQSVSPPWYMANAIKDLIEALDSAALKDMHIMHDSSRNRILFFIQSTEGGEYDTIFSYNYGHRHAGQVDTDGGVNPNDLRQGTWSNVELPASVNPTTSHSVTPSSIDAPWIGTEDGNIYHIQKPGVLNYDLTPGSGSEAVACTFQTTAFPMSAQPDYDGQAQYVIMNMESVVSGTWDLEFEILTDANGYVLTSTGISIPVTSGSSSQMVPMPFDNMHGSYGRITLSNTALGEAGIVRDLRVGIIEGHFRGPRVR